MRMQLYVDERGRKRTHLSRSKQMQQLAAEHFLKVDT